MPNDTSHQQNRRDEAEEKLIEPASYEELAKKLSEAEQKANENWERLLRMQAEADNAQRRAERDVANAHKYALEKFVSELLPIIDSLELSIANSTPQREGAVQAMQEGVELTIKMVHTAFEKFGVKQVNPVNQPFNPEFEQAISMQVNPNLAPGTVISVLQKGYTLNNRLIRPALVVVSKLEE